MLKYIKESDNYIIEKLKSKPKQWLNKKQPKQTQLQMIGYHSTDTSATQYLMQYICNECKPTTYKNICIATENHGEKMGSLSASW